MLAAPQGDGSAGSSKRYIRGVDSSHVSLANLDLSRVGLFPLPNAVLFPAQLLALHVFAVSILIVQPNNPRRVRMMTGTVISGLLILAIAAWLRLVF